MGADSNKLDRRLNVITDAVITITSRYSNVLLLSYQRQKCFLIRRTHTSYHQCIVVYITLHTFITPGSCTEVDIVGNSFKVSYIKDFLLMQIITTVLSLHLTLILNSVPKKKSFSNKSRGGVQTFSCGVMSSDVLTRSILSGIAILVETFAPYQDIKSLPRTRTHTHWFSLLMKHECACNGYTYQNQNLLIIRRYLLGAGICSGIWNGSTGNSEANKSKVHVGIMGEGYWRKILKTQLTVCVNRNEDPAVPGLLCGRKLSDAKYAHGLAYRLHPFGPHSQVLNSIEIQSMSFE